MRYSELKCQRWLGSSWFQINNCIVGQGLRCLSEKCCSFLMPFIILSTCLNSNFYVVPIHFAWNDSFLVWRMSNALGYCGHKTGSLFGARDHFLSFFCLCKTCNFLALQIPTLTLGDHKGNFVGNYCSCFRSVISHVKVIGDGWVFSRYVVIRLWEWRFQVALTILWSCKNYNMLLSIHDIV